MEYFIIFIFGLWLGTKFKTPKLFKKANSFITKSKRAPIVHGDEEAFEAELRSSNPNAAKINTH